jgi:hypothetical protein
MTTIDDHPEDTDDRAELLALIDSTPAPDYWEELPPDARHDDLVDAMAQTMRWARAATYRRDRVARPFDRELERLHAAREEAVGPRDREVARLLARLAELHAALYRLDKTTTLDLPHGTSWSRKTGGRREVVDEAAALAWARANYPRAVKVGLLVSELPKQGDVPGTRITPEDRNFGTRLA